MDGARLMNAVVASGTFAHFFAAEVDSLWMCFTKSLRAPVGAVLAGSRAFIASARRHKHAFHGAMRQAGMMAAGCLYALDYHVERLAEDHQKARDLTQGLAAISGLRLMAANAIPESNMVFFDATELGLASEKQANAVFVEAMFEQGIRLGLACSKIRAVTHLDIIRAEDIETTLAAARFVAQKAHGG